MWKQLSEFFRHVLFLTQETQKNQDDIRRLEQEMREVRDALKLLAFEVSKLGDNDKHEREMMALRLENQLLKFERRLPSPKASDETPDQIT